MASTGTLFLIFAVTFIREGNAQNTFVNVNCKENVGQYGQQSLLECIVQTTSEASDIQIRVVTWRRQGADKPALVFHDGRIDPKSSFTFAEPSWNNKNMNVSVLIPNTRVADNGRYTCMVMTNSGDGKGEVNLKVTAKYSEPIISSIPEKITPGSNGELTCETHGGYPKGDIRWFVNDNTDWTKSSKMEVKGAQDGLLHLSSKLPLLHGSIFSKYTCIVYNATGGKEAEAVFIPDPEVEEHTAVYQVSGESVTLECSFTESPNSNDELIGMYLYHDAKTQEQVLYYHSSPGPEKISPRIRYSKRVEKRGSLKKHTITISNLTVEDSGIYRCVYKKNVQSEDIRNVYILVVSEVAPYSVSKKESEPDGSEECLPLMLIIGVTSAVSIMVTMIFTWLIVPKVKQWTSRRRIRNVPQQSNEYVYEIMTKNGLCPLGASD
uniref:Ig-like domain-containing protein n=1 Tax=Lates calcarifer TaxID=8187 RepID=A0A4W6FS85_LATCA